MHGLQWAYSYSLVTTQGLHLTYTYKISVYNHEILQSNY